MQYIISIVPVEELQKYHIPFIKPSFTRDIEGFFATDEGKEFLNISPLKIYHTPNKKVAIAEVATDVALIGLCYDCPLCITFLNDVTYSKLFDLGLYGYSNLENCVKMQENNMKSKISISDQYFGGDFERISEECKKVMQFKLSKDNMAKYLLKDNKITKID